MRRQTGLQRVCSCAHVYSMQRDSSKYDRSFIRAHLQVCPWPPAHAADHQQRYGRGCTAHREVESGMGQERMRCVREGGGRGGWAGTHNTRRGQRRQVCKLTGHCSAAPHLLHNALALRALASSWSSGDHDAQRALGRDGCGLRLQHSGVCVCAQQQTPLTT